MRFHRLTAARRLAVWAAGVILASAAMTRAQTGAAEAPTPAATDTATAPAGARSSGMDAPVEYTAREIDNFVPQRLTILTGKARVKYKTATLEAGRITVDWNQNLLIAEPLPDSLRQTPAAQDGTADSLAQQAREFPVFTDGGDRMVGEKMEYNFATERGRVLRGRTEFEGGKYFGEHLKRVGEKVLNVSHGTYTTCDQEEHPHFHFYSRRMKIIVQDKVIAKPVVFYLGKIPLAILPFAWFPVRSGRHSGLIVPRYGQSTLEGRYLKDLGYYWAINDYLDARTSVDFFDRSGWFARGTVNYNKRYAFTGSLSGSVTRKNFVLTNRQDRFWDVAVSHNHTLGQTSRLSVSGRFASSNSFYSNFSDNRDQQLTRRLQSNATYSTSFDGGRSSFGINLSETKDLQDGSLQRTLPRVNFSFGQRQLFGASARERAARLGTRAGTVQEPPWYHALYFNWSSNGEYLISRGPDPNAETTRRARASHALSLSLNPRPYFGWLSLSQSLPVSIDWFDRTTEYSVTSGTGSTPHVITSREDRGFASRYAFSLSTTASTKIYGTFQPNLGAVQALRHVVTPNLSFSYRPDFSDSFWGYYQEVVLPDGTREKRDRFGGTSRGKQANLGFGLGNLFQMKTGPEDKPRKIDLFTLSFNSGYNFAAKEYKFSNLNTSLLANPGRNLSLSLSTSHSFYDYNRITGATVPQLLWAKKGLLGGKYVRLTNVSLYSSLRLEGKGGGGAPEPELVPAGSSAEFGEEPEVLPELEDRFGAPMRFADTSIPWSVSLALNLNYDQNNPLRTNRRAQLSLQNGEVRLTRNWRIGVSGQFDLIGKYVVDQQYTIHRDLHCWEMQMTWTPSGFRKGFYLRINIKAPQLRDIKIEKRGGRASVFGGSGYYY